MSAPEIDIETILCPVDFSAATPHGVLAAVGLARSTGATLRIVHVFDHPHPQLWPGGGHEPAASRTWFDEMHEAASERLDRLLEELVPADVAVEGELRGGRARPEILDLARSTPADLIVMPRHGRTGLARAAFGSTADRVVRSAACPVLTVHPGEEPAELDPRRILVATDLSSEADAALPITAALARHAGAEVYVAHVLVFDRFDPQEASFRFPKIPDTIVEQAATETTAALEKRVTRLRDCGVEARPRLLRGSQAAARLLSRTAEDEIDLLVSATRGHGRLASMLLGSTTGRLLRESTLPVLTTRREEEPDAS